jgi:desulfoferrodoxin-like iron-binding protein
MAKKTKPKSTKPESSWWKDRSKIVAKTAASKPAKPKAKKAKAKKAAKAEKGEMYYCEVCGSEVVCVEDSAGSITCCEEPMCLVC